jgi:hypothetical protein
VAVLVRARFEMGDIMRAGFTLVGTGRCGLMSTGFELARATNPRAAAIINRVEEIPLEAWERLHGAVHSLRPALDLP